MNVRNIIFLQIRSPYIKSYHPRNTLPSIQMGYMMSLIDGKYNIKFIDCKINSFKEDELIRETVKFNPDLIISNFLTYDYRFAMNYFKKLKKEIKPIIVCIGQHASFAPRSLIFKGSPVDYLLIGECELEFVNFLERLKEDKPLKKVKGIYSLEIKRIPKPVIIENLDSLPLPKHEFFDPDVYRSVYPLQLNKKAKWGYILATRGCPYNCIFCSSTVRESYGKKFRMRSVKSVVDEMEYLKSRDISVISFLDDCPTFSNSFIEKLCNEIIKRRLNIKWIIHARIDHLSRDLMKKMKEAGCLLVKVGIESGSDRIIKVLKKTNQDVDWEEKTRTFFKNAKEANLPVLAMFIIGNPTETKEDILKSWKLIKQIDPEMLQVAYFTPYPGSESFSGYCKNSTAFNEDFYHYKLFLNLSSIDSKELETLLKRIYRGFYFRPQFILRHLRKHLIFYVLNPYALKNLFKLASKY